MASDDYILEALSGALQGFSSAYLPYKQAEFQDSLLRRRKQEDNAAELELFKQKLPLEEESAIRREKAKPQTMYQALDYDTGETIGLPSLAKPVPVAKNPALRQTAEEKEAARLEAKKIAMKPKTLKSLSNFNANTDNTIKQIEELLNDSRLGEGAGFGGNLKSRLPGTRATDIRAKIDSIRSAVSLDQLTELRAASPTGGALGNVSDAEGRRLETSKANINPDQSPRALKASLEALKATLKQSKLRANEGYELDYGETPSFLTTPEIGGPAFTDPAKQARYEAWKKSKAER